MGNLKLEDDDQEEKKLKKMQEMYKSTTDWFKDTLGNKIEKAVVSNRLLETPAILVSSQYGWSNNMVAQKTMELNPGHPIVKEIKSRVEKDGQDQEAKDMAATLYDVALVQAGLTPSDPHHFAARLESLMRLGLGVSKDEKIEDPEVVLDPEPEPEPAKEESADADEKKDEPTKEEL